MFGSEILGVSLGLILVYLLLSLIASAATEIIEACRKKRASDLERGVRTLLADPSGRGLTQRLYEHPLIASLTLGTYEPQKIKNGRYKTGSDLPSYIPSRNFALALLDLFIPVTDARQADKAEAPEAFKPLKQTVSTIDNAYIKKVFGSFISVVEDDVDKLRVEVEAWYDSGMDRVAGWYKRYAQWVTLAVGLTIAVAINADTIAIGTSLTQDEATRNAMLGIVADYAAHLQANSDVGATPASGQEAAIDRSSASLTNDELVVYLNNLKRVGLPLGWNTADPRTFPEDIGGWALKILGWFITALAVSLGAPFWFDLLNKFMIVRSTVKPYEKRPAEAPVG